MIVSRSARLCFVHVQKTGGLTVERMLGDVLPDLESLSGLGRGRHATLEQGLQVHPEIGDFWTFGFVRNPWARLWSWWSMIQRRLDAAAGGNEFVARRLSTNAFWRRVGTYDDFESFILQGLPAMPRLQRPQIDYLRTPSRSADFIGQTESLLADMDQVFAYLNSRPLLSQGDIRRNADPSGSTYREHYSARMIDTVAEYYAADIAYFGYNF